MNNLRLWAPVAIALFIGTGFLVAQGNSTSIRRAVVFRSNQETVSGRLIAVEDDYILLLTSRDEEKIGFQNINRIMLAGDSKPSTGLIHGVILGCYLGLNLSCADNSQPVGYLRGDRFSFWGLVAVMGACGFAGGYIGSLVDAGSDAKEEFFDFTGSEWQRRAEQKRLRKVWKANSGERNIHVSLQGSQVYSSVVLQDAFSNQATSSSDLSGFNLLRKIQATYSVQSDIELGAAVLFFGQPRQDVEKREYPASGNPRYIGSTQILKAVGGYVIGAIEPFHGLLNKWLGITAGGGFGIAMIDYSREGRIHQMAYINGSWQVPYSPTETLTFRSSDTHLSGFLYGEVRVRCDDGLSAGLNIDHVFAPSATVPADPLLGTSAQSLNFGNTSVGFVIVFHI